MKNESLCFCLIIFLSIFGLGFCVALRKLTTNNESAPLQNIKHLNYNEHDGVTSQTTYKSLITEYNNEAIIKDHNTTLLENPTMNKHNIDRDPLRDLRMSEYFDAEIELINAVFYNVSNEISLSHSCNQMKEILYKFKLFEFYYDYFSGFLGFAFKTNNNFQPLSCTLTATSTEIQRFLSVVDSIKEISKQFINNENGIICNKTKNKCEVFEELNFYDLYKIDNLIEQINGISSDADGCFLRMLNLVFYMIDSHNIVVNKCESKERKDEVKRIFIAFNKIMIDVLEDIKESREINYINIEEECPVNEKYCITTGTYEVFWEYFTNFTHKASDEVSMKFLDNWTTENTSKESKVSTMENESESLAEPTTTNKSKSKNSNDAISHTKSLILILYCLVFYYLLGY